MVSRSWGTQRQVIFCDRADNPVVDEWLNVLIPLSNRLGDYGGIPLAQLSDRPTGGLVKAFG